MAATVSFGIVGGVTCAYGTVNTAGQGDSIEVALARNALGVVTNMQAHGKTSTAQLSGVFTGTAPLAGASLTIFSVDGLADSVEVTEENTGYTMVSASVVKHWASKSVAATHVALA
jgi:hypothetical protein